MQRHFAPLPHQLLVLLESKQRYSAVVVVSFPEPCLARHVFLFTVGLHFHLHVAIRVNARLVFHVDFLQCLVVFVAIALREYALRRPRCRVVIRWFHCGFAPAS